MIDQSCVDKMKKIFPNIHPLIFQRSMEKAENSVALFEILDCFPNKYPVVWDETSHRWKVSDDLSMADRFNSQKRSE